MLFFTNTVSPSNMRMIRWLMARVLAEGSLINCCKHTVLSLLGRILHMMERNVYLLWDLFHRITLSSLLSWRKHLQGLLVEVQDMEALVKLTKSE
uniref:AGO902 n=1 Tax=Arundo donax TaxID=35708 RepID=A0A0A9CY65_ARUDO